MARAAKTIEVNSKCPIHKEQFIVAFDAASHSFACQACLFEGDYKNPQFVAFNARETYDKISNDYEEFKEVL
jgi:hypothetical protein